VFGTEAGFADFRASYESWFVKKDMPIPGDLLLLPCQGDFHFPLHSVCRSEFFLYLCSRLRGTQVSHLRLPQVRHLRTNAKQ
jgi:hypothetical protein